MQKYTDIVVEISTVKKQYTAIMANKDADDQLKSKDNENFVQELGSIINVIQDRLDRSSENTTGMKDNLSRLD